MRKWRLASGLAVFAAGLSVACAAPGEQCPPRSGIALQVLGSGGPIADDARASAGYLVWIDGAARVLTDTGGGIFLRFAEAGASFSDIDFIGLSHFHADHSADFPALLKSGYFSNRTRSLIVSGPGSGGPFPSLSAYLHSMLDKTDGAYGYLSGYLDGSGGMPEIVLAEVSRDHNESVTVFRNDERQLRIDALHVPHGIVPALAFRIEIGPTTIVFAGDQNGNDPRFIEFAKNADALVMHMAVPDGIEGAARKLHAPPGVIGAIATKAQAKTLVLSHLMSRSLNNIGQNVDIVKSQFVGPVIVANDLACFGIDPPGTPSRP